MKDANGWITVGDAGRTVSVANNSDLIAGTIAVEAHNDSYAEFDTIGLTLTPTEARQLAAALVALADEIEGGQG